MTSYDFNHSGFLKKSLDEHQLKSDNNNIAAKVINQLNALYSYFIAKGFGLLVPIGTNASVQAVTITKVVCISTCVHMCVSKICL